MTLRRLAEVEPNACLVCDIPEHQHYDGRYRHRYVTPHDQLRKARMLARRKDRSAPTSERLTMSEINLKVELPDGTAHATRTFPRSVAVLPSSNPDAYRAWLAEQLPQAVDMLFERAGMPTPLAPFYESLPEGAPRTPETLLAVFDGFGAARDVLHATARALNIDVDGQLIDTRNGLMVKAPFLPSIASERMRDLNGAVDTLKRHKAAFDQLRALLPDVVGDLPVSQIPSLVEAKLVMLASEVDKRGEVIDRVKEAAGLIGELRDDTADEDLPAAIRRVFGLGDAQLNTGTIVKLLATYRLPQAVKADEVFSELQKARQREMRKASEEAYRQARKDTLNELLDRFDLAVDTKDAIEAVDEQFLQYKSREDDRDEKVRRETLVEVLAALELPSDSEDPIAAMVDLLANARRLATSEAEQAASVRLEKAERELARLRAHAASVAQAVSFGSPMQWAAIRDGMMPNPALLESWLSDAVDVTRSRLTEHRMLEPKLTQATADRDVLARVLVDVRAAIGKPELSDTQTAGAVSRMRAELVADTAPVDALTDAINGVRDALTTLTGSDDYDSLEVYPDENLGDAVRHVVLRERWPVGTPVRVVRPGDGAYWVGVVHAVEEDSPEPVTVLLANGSRVSVTENLIERATAVRPLPEGGLKDILDDADGVDPAEVLKDAFEGAMEELGDRLSGWGDRAAARTAGLLDGLAAKLAGRGK